MSDFEERRAFKRFPVPEGRVYYKKVKRLPLLNKLSGPMPMKDISKSGVCFIVNNPIQTGEIVAMEIVIPGQEKIRLKGEIRWIGPQREVGATFTGLQFLPFGSKKQFNSLKDLEKLRRLTEYFDNAQDDEKPN